MAATYLKRRPFVWVLCVNLFSQIDSNAFLKLPCSARSETLRKWAAFLLQDSDSSLARNSSSFHPACTSLTQQRWSRTWVLWRYDALLLSTEALFIPAPASSGSGTVPSRWDPQKVQPRAPYPHLKGLCETSLAGAATASWCRAKVQQLFTDSRACAQLQSMSPRSLNHILFLKS